MNFINTGENGKIAKIKKRNKQEENNISPSFFSWKFLRYTQKMFDACFLQFYELIFHFLLYVCFFLQSKVLVYSSIFF